MQPRFPSVSITLLTLAACCDATRQQQISVPADVQEFYLGEDPQLTDENCMAFCEDFALIGQPVDCEVELGVGTTDGSIVITCFGETPCR